MSKFPLTWWVANGALAGVTVGTVGTYNGGVVAARVGADDLASLRYLALYRLDFV